MNEVIALLNPHIPGAFWIICDLKAAPRDFLLLHARCILPL